MKNKRVLIHTSMFIADLKKNYAMVLENIDKTKYNVYSPVSYIKEDNYYQLIGAVVALEKFKTEDINDKISVYIGPASSNLEFDYIITVGKVVVDAQESYLKTNIMPFFIDFNMLHSFHSYTESNLFVDTIEKAIEFLNEEY